MEYRGYVARVSYDDTAGIFRGAIVNTRDAITFQGESVRELQTGFREAVDDYLAFCANLGEKPDKPFSGQFVTRIPPELHRQIHRASRLSGQSLNAWVAEQLQAAVDAVPDV